MSLRGVASLAILAKLAVMLGNLTASLITAGAPTSSITDLANARDIRVVPLAGPEGAVGGRAERAEAAVAIIDSASFRRQHTFKPSLSAGEQFYEPVQVLVASEERLDGNSLVAAMGARFPDVACQP